MEDVEARFAHLLQPIRDLTKNWEVDVAAQLGEYLEELDQICISFDEGKTTMNFVEAALLIQGSACVYSKKVEYLYSLVYQALDFISGKRRAKQLSSVQEDGASGDTGSGARQEVADDEFLSLDDLPDSRSNVNLRTDHAPSEVLIIPLLPMALVALDEMERNASPLYSCQGEVLASRKDFRMNTCTPHPRGAFMLEPVGMSSMETLLPRTEAGRAEEQPMEVSLCRSPGPVPSISQEPGTSPEGPVPGVGGEDEDAEGAAELPEVTDPKVSLQPQEPRSPQQSTAQPKRCTLRERPQVPEPLSQLKETPDPWQSLDPFNSLESKPFKKGNWLEGHVQSGICGEACWGTTGGELCPVPAGAWQGHAPLPETRSVCHQVGPTLCLPAWRRLQDRNARGRVPPSCRTSTSGTWPPMPTTLTSEDADERASPLLVRLGPRVCSTG
ncbi:condensin-2 complex subunit H2 isoform 7-T8 [Hipposideros larvatus]